MVFHMKTTLIIADPVYKDLKRRAAERGETISSLVAELLRKGLAKHRKPVPLRPLPVFDLGRPRLNIADRDALYEAMENN